ncbi:PREDICTED: uncharacterized protein LOC106747846 [Dinoponera quadriceps]|uniref:Uncharacterized protein LOC106747846 n=1 Tax=Dinoponera quadriceps TaxID=609295 RepID=A0A6P3XS86_DINQU|nr:PREDICTED: uncharacterized protein LOC106747846 [Dinoponera quadriceps]
MRAVRDQSPPTGEKTPVLPCDEESSFASVDDVFFFCEQQQQQQVVCQETHRPGSFKKTRSKDENPNAEDNSKKCSVRSESKNFKKDFSTNAKDKGQSKVVTDEKKVTDCHDFRFNRTDKVTKKYTYLPKNLKNPFAQNQKNIVHRSLKNSFGQNHKKTDSQRAHTTLIDILVEDCRQCAIGEKSVASFSNASGDVKRDITDCRGTLTQPTAEKKSPGSRFKYNCIESTLELNSANKNNGQRYYNKISIVDNITKCKKSDEVHTETTKKFFWGCTCTKMRRKGLEKCKEQEKSDSIESFDSYNDAKQLKKKKPACSPLKKLGRSSLTVGSDKIAINLPKYSPCASRLAAGSKILSSDLAADPDSPLHVPRSRSPSNVDIQQTENSAKPSERTSMQASLSLNIQQFQRSRYTPRSRSVGDSCVTSPTSEATTVSYSPTGTEILSLEEVGPHTSSAEGSVSYSEVKEKLEVVECSDKVNRRTTLETKC